MPNYTLTTDLINILSLFDGMSVAQQALAELKLPVETYFASEIDEYAKSVTQSNFPNTIQLGSVVGLQINKPIDLLIGGSPCQDLSIAKKNRKGLEGSRSGLFWEYVRIRDEVKPKYFILENVASMSKQAKETITEALGVEPVMINASLVSAQNRKRLFWVGKLNGEKYEQVEIPQPEDRGILLKDILEDSVEEKYCADREKSYCIDAIRASVQKNAEQYDNGKTPALTSAMGMGGGNVPMMMDKKTAEELKGKYIDGEQRKGIRKLTPTECLRLQSMPDDYFDKAEYKNRLISKTQRYKMCGNAFNCEVIKHIISNLNLATLLVKM